MTWIKTVSMLDDERLKFAMEAQRKLYPQEYAIPVPAVDHGAEAESSHRTRYCRMCCFIPSARLAR